VLAVAVALTILYLAFRGPSGKPVAAVGPSASAGPQPATTVPGGTAPLASTAAPGSPAQGSTAPGRTSLASRPASPAAGSPGSAGPLAAARSYLSGRSGTVMAAVYDLRTGHEWTVGQGNAQAEASIVKVDILETLLAQRPPGGLTGNDSALARKMIEDSDNDAATALWGLVGGSKGVATYNTQAGLAGTTPSACLQCPGFPWPGWGLTTTTPHDQITLLRQLFTSGGQLTSADRQYALSLLENVTPAQRWGVSGGVPTGVTVALKNGWLPLDAASSDWQINSVGWVSGQGRDYLMAVLSTGNPSEQYGISTLNALGSMVWKALASLQLTLVVAGQPVAAGDRVPQHDEGHLVGRRLLVGRVRGRVPGVVRRAALRRLVVGPAGVVVIGGRRGLPGAAQVRQHLHGHGRRAGQVVELLDEAPPLGGGLAERLRVLGVPAPAAAGVLRCADDGVAAGDALGQQPRQASGGLRLGDRRSGRRGRRGRGSCGRPRGSWPRGSWHCVGWPRGSWHCGGRRRGRGHDRGGLAPRGEQVRPAARAADQEQRDGDPGAEQPRRAPRPAGRFLRARRPGYLPGG
jgi:hypothetical protein